MKKGLFLFLGLVFLVSLAGFVNGQENFSVNASDGSLVACPEDAKVCPDGSVVTRNASLDCAFDECASDCVPAGGFCGGIAGFACCSGLTCDLEGDFADASGTCVTELNGSVQEEVICEDLCGDGVCQEIVCLGEGCPCAETPEICSADCSALEVEEPTDSGSDEDGISLFWVFVILVVVIFLIIVGLKIAKWLMWAAIIAGVLMLLWFFVF